MTIPWPKNWTVYDDIMKGFWADGLVDPSNLDEMSHEARIIAHNRTVRDRRSAPRCFDCGTEPVWWFVALGGGPSYCRRCHSKAGHWDYVELDPDKLAGLLGRDLAMRALLECRREW